MSRQAYKVRDSDGTVIGQYYTTRQPDKPDNWDGEWHIETVDRDDLDSDPVEWWDEQS